ncbi:MAG: DEAD/DEAH box helicase [Patescibacteria group bacterium]|nr:DEAD/DEAH box helicase [Patescibacteria group bacterium]MDD5164491.1 DEAD/DEAH box helicase [Patescibacteria group bacterium]MDD5534141.1 DEAD/DEAH box helicase [Patescibacteria group bacterium]
MTQNSPQTAVQNFAELGIAPALYNSLLKLNLTVPTPIQQKTIPIALEGKDVVGIAQTGTGKTLAFGLPMIQRLNQIKGCGLVVLPTRELALQVDEALYKVGAAVGLRTAVVIGGAPMGAQIRALNRSPHIIIATPGRLNDHLQQRTVRLNNVVIAVLDEADRMLDMGFAPQIKTIFQAISPERQTMLFSATMPAEILTMAKTYMKLPIQIEVAPTGTTVDKVTQEIFIIPQQDKFPLLEKLLTQYKGSVLIFTRTKHGAKKLNESIQSLGYTANEIHSNRSLGQRREALTGFKTGKYRVLVATDVASRGVDVVGIELVINYDLPENSEDYVHRIGRTARAGAVGHAISFATPYQRGELRDIERLVRKNIPISKTPELPPMRKGLTQQKTEAPRRRENTAPKNRDDYRSYRFHKPRRY